MRVTSSEHIGIQVIQAVKDLGIVAWSLNTS